MYFKDGIKRPDIQCSICKEMFWAYRADTCPKCEEAVNQQMHDMTKQLEQRIKELEEENLKLQSLIRNACVGGAEIFICQLIDNCEGETITEEFLQAEYSKFLKQLNL